jgi:hypothetical protein
MFIIIEINLKKTRPIQTLAFVGIFIEENSYAPFLSTRLEPGWAACAPACVARVSALESNGCPLFSDMKWVSSGGSRWR